MQGMVFDIMRFAVYDGPGIRTTVFFKGCSQNCYWCHNPESIEMQPFSFVKKVVIDGKIHNHNETIGKLYTVEEIIDILSRDRIFMEESGGGVTFSGGEPTMQPVFLISLLEACQKEGLHTAVDTNGLASKEVMQKIMPLTDLFLFDVKHLDPKKHKAGTGTSNELILDNLKFLLKNNSKLRIRIPVIPGFNFNAGDMRAILVLIDSLPGTVKQVDLLPYHTIARNKYKRFGIKNKDSGVSALKIEDLDEVKQIFVKGGYDVTIGG